MGWAREVGGIGDGYKGREGEVRLVEANEDESPYDDAAEQEMHEAVEMDMWRHRAEMVEWNRASSRQRCACRRACRGRWGTISTLDEM